VGVEGAEAMRFVEVGSENIGEVWWCKTRLEEEGPPGNKSEEKRERRRKNERPHLLWVEILLAIPK